MDHQPSIGNIITSNIHRPCLHEHVENIADVSPMCLGHVRRLFGDISPLVLGVGIAGENSNACIEFFLDAPMPWQGMAITRLRRR